MDFLSTYSLTGHYIRDTKLSWRTNGLRHSDCQEESLKINRTILMPTPSPSGNLGRGFGRPAWGCCATVNQASYHSVTFFARIFLCFLFCFSLPFLAFGGAFFFIILPRFILGGAFFFAFGFMPCRAPLTA